MRDPRLSIPYYQLRSSLYNRMRSFGVRRRYFLLGPLLDQLTEQRLFNTLPESAQKEIVDTRGTARGPDRVEPIPLFLHIPKCAGSAIGKMFDEKVGPWGWYKTIERPIDGYRDPKFAYGANNPKIKMIQGHFDIRFLDVMRRPYKAFTFLRNPVQRVVSHYYFIREAKENNYLSGGRLSLGDVFATEHATEYENFQVRSLCGKPAGKLTDADLAQAITAVETRFAFVGRVETLNQDAPALAELFNLRNSVLEHVNVTRSRPFLSAISKADLAKIEKNNEFDWALYDHVASGALDCRVRVDTRRTRATRAF